MIPASRITHPLLRYRGRVDDGEALQTDVMRFMAILGLCLTAVFALVQSLPMELAGRQQQRAASSERAQDALLSTKLALQQARQRLAAIESQLESQERRRNDAELQLRTTADRLQQRSDSLQALIEQQLQLQAGNQRLAAEQAQRTQALQTLGRQLEQAQKVSKQLRMAEAESRHSESAATEPSVTADADSLESPVPADTSEAKGFLLRFASVEALDGLVRTGAVGFAGVVERRAWKLSMRGDQPVFVAHAPPQQMHEMAPQTVPRHYRHAFRAAAGDEASAGVVWGVTLPQAMERKIQMLTGRAQTGVLVIHADGEVRLAPGDSA